LFDYGLTENQLKTTVYAVFNKKKIVLSKTQQCYKNYLMKSGLEEVVTIYERNELIMLIPIDIEYLVVEIVTQRRRLSKNVDENRYFWTAFLSQ